MIKRLALFAAAALTLAAAEPVVFIQMSDPQFGMQTSNRDFEQETANFEFAIATANRLKPAFVVITGDLVNQAGNAAQIGEYHRIAAKLNHGIKLYSIPGNHDVGNEPTPESVAAYRDKFGRDYYSFRHGDMAGIVLDSSVISAPAKVQDEYDRQERWLKAELARLKAEGVRQLIVFQHHPYFVSDPGEKDAYDNIPLARRKIYLDLLREFGVNYVFAGHLHHNAQGKDGNLQLICTGPVGKPIGDGARSGMRIVTVSDAGVRHEFYDLGSLPNALPR
jgi:3',5'-cyclic AMP phosphodiesterase CpdA